jgi:hypothetical protein
LVLRARGSLDCDDIALKAVRTRLYDAVKRSEGV